MCSQASVQHLKRAPAMAKQGDVKQIITPRPKQDFLLAFLGDPNLDKLPHDRAMWERRRQVSRQRPHMVAKENSTKQR